MRRLNDTLVDIIEKALGSTIYWHENRTDYCVTTDWRTLPFWVILSVHSGRYSCELSAPAEQACGQRHFQAGPDEIMLIPAGVKHRLAVDTPTVIDGIHIRYSLFKSLDILTMIDLPLVVDRYQGGSLKASLHHLTLAMRDYEIRPDLKQSILQSACRHMLFHDLLDLSPTPQLDALDYMALNRLSTAIQLLEEDLVGITVEAMAKACAMSRNTFTRTFKKATGQLPVQYIKSKRLEFAMAKLVYSHDNLAQIAQDTGFCDQFHFSKTFREAIGESPSQYRLSTREALKMYPTNAAFH